MAQTERYVWLDTLRLTAGVSMIGLHATADANGQPFVGYSEVERIAPMLVRAVIYVARTELFIIIALFLLLMSLDRRPRSYSRVIADQARRLLVPFGFWTIFYAFYSLLKADAFGYGTALRAELADPVIWARYLLLGGSKYHMHFIPTLFGIILAYPLFRLAVKQPILGLGVLASLALKRELDGFVYSTFWDTEALSWIVRFVKCLTYVGYGMVAGAFLGLWRRSGALADPADAREAWVPPLLFAGAALFLAKLAATWLTVQKGEWPYGFAAGYWADYLMPIVLFAICMCLAGRRWPGWISVAAPYAFGIYLCHPIFLDLAEIAIAGVPLSPILQVGVKIGIALSGTSALVWLIGRCPPLAWTIGLGALPLPRRFRTATAA
ncbi:acyltransferase [Tropicimonas sp. IMCC34011]|uniref:acyltransferase n=1 Tax=Tropicimonas sp. IMCC34011 TaxID=2248759 RepID=UPI000E26006C|nr:acyltransferase [Tropicimonas sp. IMCC34011]